MTLRRWRVRARLKGDDGVSEARCWTRRGARRLQRRTRVEWSFVQRVR